jgi:hypothetical protein
MIKKTMNEQAGNSKALTLGWKIYAWIYLILVVVAVLPSFAFYPFDLLIIVRTLISFIVILGVFGYAYSRAIFTRGFWMVFFFVAIIDEFINITDLIYMSEAQRAASILSYAIVLPCFFALYFYIFKSQFIWAKKMSHRKKDKDETG